MLSSLFYVEGTEAQWCEVAYSRSHTIKWQRSELQGPRSITLLVCSILFSVPRGNAITSYHTTLVFWALILHKSMNRYLKCNVLSDKMPNVMFSWLQHISSKCLWPNYVILYSKQCPKHNLKILFWEHQYFVKQTFRIPETKGLCIHRT